jgi:hypothetical protein
MEGQIILVDKLFLFMWVPIGRQIFFGRRLSAELTIQMMRDAEERRNRGNGDDNKDVGAMRDVAMSKLADLRIRQTFRLGWQWF